MNVIKKYYDFILEYDVYHDTRSKAVELNNKSILDLLKEKAPWYLNNINNITPIYRGIKGDRYKDENGYKKAFEISPGMFTRYARNVDNLYIELIDNSPYWLEFPKRSKSIICSTDFEKASIYGYIYRVIPLNENSILSICPTEDVFTSFTYLMDKLNVINSKTSFLEKFLHLRDFNGWLSYGFGINEEADYDGIKSVLYWTIKDIEQNDYDLDEFNEELHNLIRNMKLGKFMTDNLGDDVEEWMTPENNKFKTIKYNRNSKIPNEREVYTDSDCLLILESSLQKELHTKFNK